MSAYYLEHASVEHVQKHFDFFEEEARWLLSLGLAIPAYDHNILFNYLLYFLLFSVLSVSSVFTSDAYFTTTC